jgi:hypothetical protein
MMSKKEEANIFDRVSQFLDKQTNKPMVPT